MGAGCVMANGLGAVVRVSGDRMLVRHLSRRADRGRRACDDWLTFAELAAGGALAYCTGTTPDTG